MLKTLASAAFVALAWSLPGSGSDYGRWVVAALALSALGDVFLLSARSALFLAGLGAFLAAHLAFATAFAQRDLDPDALRVAAVILVAAAALTMRWLWPRLSPHYRWAVGAYVAAIAGMCTLAIASSAGSGHWQVAAGALGFAASDLAVARDRFVAPGRLNKVWGLPAYYVSQLVLAWSIAGSV